MGYTTEANKALRIDAVVKLLELVREDAEEAPPGYAADLYKFGAAVVVAQCGSLRGPEVLTMDLSGLRTHISLGIGPREDPEGGQHPHCSS